MAAPVASIVDRAGRIIEMRQSPTTAQDNAFDSYMILKENGVDNHTLTLVLRIHFKQVVPASSGTHTDVDGTVFKVRRWRPSELDEFHRMFRRQAALWNNNFWLTPPAGFAGLQYRHAGKNVQPNVYCHLFVDIAASPAGAHRTIDIVNIDRVATARARGVRVADLNASTFRSDSTQYDSLDVKPAPLPFPDDTGTTHRLNRSTFAHEVGHALGLPHSGQAHSTIPCTLSVLMDEHLPSWISGSASFPALYQGGSNSNVCYGHSGPKSVGSNVMGFGLELDASNALPWLDRLALHTGTRAADWTVALKRKVPPRVL